MSRAQLNGTGVLSVEDLVARHRVGQDLGDDGWPTRSDLDPTGPPRTCPGCGAAGRRPRGLMDSVA
jgi:hypothetical protein